MEKFHKALLCSKIFLRCFLIKINCSIRVESVLDYLEKLLHKNPHEKHAHTWQRKSVKRKTQQQLHIVYPTSSKTLNAYFFYTYC